MAELVAVSGPDRGRVFTLKGEKISVGRHSENQITLTDPRVSRKHFELRAGPNNTYQLFDLQSGNGTSVNGRTVQVIDLRNHDRIGAGETELLYKTSHAEPARTGETTRLIVSSTMTDGASAVVRKMKADEGSLILQRRDATMLAAMFEVSEAVTRLTDEAELLDRVLEVLLRNIPADHACAMLHDKASETLLPRAVRSRPGASSEFVVSRTIIDLALKQNEAIYVRDAATDERFISAGASIAKHQLRDVICVPLRGRRETVGVLFLDTVSQSRLTEAHLPLAVAMGYQAAVAVEESRAYEARLQAERLAVVGQTIAAMSHHIKNIMQGVQFGSDMVRLGLNGDTEMLRKGWKLVERNQHRIDELILDMLSYSKEREPALEETDLLSLAADVIDIVRGRAESHGIVIEWQQTILPVVMCDPVGIHRALLNILSNAVDAVSGQESPHILVSTGQSEDFAELIVTDNGPGIPTDKLKELFKPFVSTKGARGTGLGLPVSLKILQEHGGTIDVSASESGGARFTLKIPLRRAD